MKKVLWIGCGCAVLLVMGAVGMGLFAYVRFVRPAIEATQAVQREYQETNARFPFTAPASELMDEGRFLEFLTIRGAVATEATKAAADLDEMGKKMSGEKKPSLSAVANLATVGVGLVGRITKVHIEQLQARQMSAKEYHWYSQAMIGTVNEAAKIGRAEAKPFASFFGGPPSPGKPNALAPGKTEEAGQELAAVKFPFHEENFTAILANEDAITTPPAVRVLDSLAISLMRPGSGQPLEVEKR